MFTEEDNREKGKLYKPQNKHEEKTQDKSNEYAKLVSLPSAASILKKDNSTKKISKSQEKKKSNLELFKEELRQ